MLPPPRSSRPAPPARAPKVGFVSLGCPKALVDSELILTQLRAEGYATSKTYDGADLVIVNTCGFIDDAVAGILDTIGEALAENGKVIVTGCLGAKQARRRDLVRADASEGARRHRPARDRRGDGRGARASAEAARSVRRPRAAPHGIKLTPQHYAYLKISEGCNHRCTFCIIPSMRGDLVSPPDRRRARARREHLFEGGREGAARRSARTRAPTASTSSTAPASGTAGR